MRTHVATEAPGPVPQHPLDRHAARPHLNLPEYSPRMDRPDPVDARLTELEIKASLAEDTVDRLNEVVIAQQARLDALAREVARLARLLQEGSGDAPALRSLRDEIPPHY